ncbi:RNA 3'-terminal phosphate cyclase-like [Homarus americanus]|uniref:RNA 3'-terminal phosphate cyclase-like n=1 Tax=Homarus americanus TaxID=6706 RepID=UPI001C46ACE7|nr:RNA 3'-terminal phosphate cyclase-like [Homarus americanus]
MAAATPVVIDGSYLEGGGQILRMGLALSAVRDIPITVNKVRAGRKNPGLRPQHLTGLQIARDACNGKLEGGQIGSCEVSFYPDHISGGRYMADTQTAGSVSLLVQSVLPCALYADSPSCFVLRGGTNAEFAPQVDYTIQVFRKVLSWFGGEFQLSINKRGFYPMGKGEVTLKVKPSVEGLYAADFTDFGELVYVYGTAYVSGVLPIKVAHKMADAAQQLLLEKLPKNVEIYIDRIKEHAERGMGNGSGIVLWAETTTGCVLGGAALGKRGRGAEEDGLTAANEILHSVERRACVDKYAQDQVIIFMALAKGKSRIRTGPLTDHTKTAMWVAKLLTKVEFNIIEEEGTDCIYLECEGIGHMPVKRNK